MKKLCVAALCLCLLALCACGSPYADIIKNLKDSSMFYALYDLDGNGTKELLLGYETWGDIMCPYLVFATQNGVAVQQEAYLWFEGNGPPPVVYRTGTIKAEFSDDGGSTFYYYKMEDGELRYQTMLVADNREFDNEIHDYRHEYFRFDPDTEKSISVTQKEFERLQKELEGDGMPADLDWKVPT